MTEIRRIIFYKDHFKSFFVNLPDKVKQKFRRTMELIELRERIPVSQLKHIKGTSGLYEIRVQLGSNIWRVFCFFNQYNQVVFLNAFQKKTQKTPSGEIQKALKLKEQYEQYGE